MGDGDELIVYVWDGMSWREIFSRMNGTYYDYFYWWTMIDIPESYRNENMMIRFRWTTDGSDNGYFGAEIDNIRLQCIDDNEENYGYNSGTSMATPHVAGVAALVMANPPGGTPISLQELKTRLIWTGDPIPALDGKSVSGSLLSLPAYKYRWIAVSHFSTVHPVSVASLAAAPSFPLSCCGV